MTALQSVATGASAVTGTPDLYDSHTTERPAKRLKTKAMGDEPIEHQDAVPAHPLEVKPQGNAYAVDSGKSLRHSLGHFEALPDELLVHFLEYLGPRELLTLGGACKFLYAFCKADDLWRPLFVE
jgi:hypothetical protein